MRANPVEAMDMLLPVASPYERLVAFTGQQLRTVIAPIAEHLPERKLSRAATVFLCTAAMAGALAPGTAAAESGPAGAVPAITEAGPGVASHEAATPVPPSIPSVNEECGDPSYRAPKQVQIDSMLCRFNNVRSTPLVEDPELKAAAEAKLGDEIRCRSESHLPCEQDEDPFEHTKQEKDLTLTPTWEIGENLAYGESIFGKARSIFGGWWQSPSHRSNILDERFTNVGIAIKHVRRIVMDVDLENGMVIRHMLLRNVNFLDAEFWGPSNR